MAGSMQFWFDFASTYSYLSITRVEQAAAAAGVEVAWRPFLLGPIFKAQGWTTSPFNLYPAKGRYMVRDCTRIAEARGISFKMPSPFPQSSVLAARVALVALEGGWGPAFIKAVFERQFVEGASIAEAADLMPVVAALGQAPSRVFATAESDTFRLMLRGQVDMAQSYGVFGAPTFRTSDGELFWGDDRLDAALAHTAQLASRPATRA